MQLYESLTQESIDRAEAHADAIWTMEAHKAVREVAKRQGVFTTDAVWEEIERTGAFTHEPRALGAVMLRAIKDGLIMATGAYRKSRRTSCHHRPIRVYVWRSDAPVLQ